MSRVTIKQLESQVSRINQLTGSPAEPYTRIEGKLTGNIGNYHLDQAYGGIKLVRMCNESGGISLVSREGYVNKGKLSTWMGAFIAGLELKGDAA
jgi:hypothetical protein